MKISVRKLVLSAMFLSLCMLLPFLTGQVPEIGSMLLPMHLPVLIAGFVLGAPYGALIGLVAPILRFFVFGKPMLFPAGAAMAVEMCAYGLGAGFFYRVLPQKRAFVYVSLVLSMIVGRIAWGAAQYVFLMADGSALTVKAFVAGAFVNAWPGIILQLALVPAIVIALERAKLIKD
ncbi:MAG: ECF transporter S component [Clostridia bacterium]|nr:ECF transporter S component [Clostridia bacterium]